MTTPISTTTPFDTGRAHGSATDERMVSQPSAVEGQADLLWMAPSQLKPWKDNPRNNDGEPVAKVAQSITRFGFGAPIVARADNREIIAGHTRWKAALKLKLERVPVRLLDIDEHNAHLLALADNRLTELTAWSDTLSTVLKSFDAGERDLAGWTAKDVEELERKMRGGAGELDEDEVPEPPANPVTQVGDVWTLGKHRLVCGDATLAAVHAALMVGQALALVVTDPPYGVSYADKNKRLNELDDGKRIETPIENDHQPIADIAEHVWRPVFQCLHDVAAPGCALYSFAPQGGDQMMMMMMMMMQDTFPVRHELIWVKNNHVLGRADYQYKHEPILYAWKKGGHKYYGGFQTSLLEYARQQKSDLHPTMKPVALIGKLIENSSLRGGAVGDPFMGSGTTIIAAEQLERIGYGIELSPAYCDVIIERWQNLTSGKAQRAAQT